MINLCSAVLSVYGLQSSFSSKPAVKASAPSQRPGVASTLHAKPDEKLLADIASVLQEASHRYGEGSMVAGRPTASKGAPATARPQRAEPDASLLEERLSLQKAREALIEERDAMAAAHKRRMTELDGECRFAAVPLLPCASQPAAAANPSHPSAMQVSASCLRRAQQK